MQDETEHSNTPDASRQRSAEGSQGSSEAKRKRRKLRWRPVLRGLHRDAGYLVVGLTVVYALSGLAVNHIEDWDPNFTTSQTEHAFPIPDETMAASQAVLDRLDVESEPRSIYRAAPNRLEIVVDDGLMISADPLEDTAIVNRRDSRVLLRAANWLHLNRGKRAWTFIADGYAILLLFLALSGLFMVRGRYGVAGRGWVLVLFGISIPVLYVWISGGPDAQHARSSEQSETSRVTIEGKSR